MTLNWLRKRLDSSSTLIILLSVCHFYTFINGQTSSNACSDIETLWLKWSAWSDCTDTCGSCGIHMRTRVCLTTDAECRCDGSSTQLDYCNLEICRYPRPSCCFNKTVTPYDGKFLCL